MVVAPSSTVDMATADGSMIEIEHRPGAELLAVHGQGTAAPGADAWNPVFDVTPAGLIDVIVTERGVIESPLGDGLARMFARPFAARAG
jgi:methylthioribose-1-phosphate isomerase